MWLVYSWQLAKVPLCLLICCSAFFGAVLADSEISIRTLHACLAVLLLAMGAATLNSIQEAGVDGTMGRTADRPLVRRRISPGIAIIQSLVLLFAGLYILYLQPGFLPLLIGLISVILYNGVYTTLKQKSILAIIPGALCGTMPPLIGWIVAGGELQSYIPFLVGALLMLWQVPHFYMVLLRHKNDYLQSRQPNFLQLLPERSVRRLSGIWICALAMVMLLFTVIPIQLSAGIRVGLVCNSLIFCALIMYHLIISSDVSYRLMFFFLNLMLFNHMALVVIGRILSR